ncbi:DUF1553 domain-containing protein [bacterium]|nr:DUF1553 domain-containing protein [bacterium]
MKSTPFSLLLATSLFTGILRSQEPAPFDQVASIFERRCLSCHNDDEKKGGLSLQSHDAFLKGGDQGPVVLRDSPAESPILLLTASKAGQAEMPQDADPLSADDWAQLRQWVVKGAPWPPERRLTLPIVKDAAGWSLQPIRSPALPTMNVDDATWAQNPIDTFVAAVQQEKEITRNSPADRRTLVRRLAFDLVGLPPEPDVVDRFLSDERPDAYDRLVDSFLASCQHGERWARHWLDVVHFGETHGYDKDQPRPNAWPYRDYVINSLNEDKPYARFVEEQLAGDVLCPGQSEGIIALGFLAAGPWDLIGHAEVPESKIDGKIARHLDRDDMVATTINTFCSMTVQCAQCHHHKFDPITQEDYYRLHAVFAAVDRTNRPFDADPVVAAKRARIEKESREIEQALAKLDQAIHDKAGPELALLEEKIKQGSEPARMPDAFGYHSQIETSADHQKWVQVDLGESKSLAKLALVACHDDFAGIGDGFGFPVRFRIDASDDPTFQTGITSLVDRTQEDFPKPTTEPRTFDFPTVVARFVRVTATLLAPRQNDFIFALAELELFGPEASSTKYPIVFVTAKDSIDAPPRWRKENLIDGLYPRGAMDKSALKELVEQREAIMQRLDAQMLEQRKEILSRQARAAIEKLTLPKPTLVYAAGIHQGEGAFAGTGKSGGEPRPIHLLARGDVRKPGELMSPGTIAVINPEQATFEFTSTQREGDRRAALARWITRTDHPLTWRSWVNRIWLYHFGHGIVDTPNDFGRMGETPSHPALLDWLANEARQEGNSWKYFHRLMVTSATYRLASEARAEASAIDADNRFLWQAPRRKLEAEELRDAILSVAGELQSTMGGPSFQDFIVEHPEHSPHYQYHLADAHNPTLHRRSIYRFLVRSQQQPWMATMDGADPSMLVDKRNQTITPLQALALWNNDLVLVMADKLADRLVREFPSDQERIDHLYRRALSRLPTNRERDLLMGFVAEHGWPMCCRAIFNMNEFVFVD